MKASDARAFAAQAAEKRRQAEERSAAAARLRVRNRRLYKQAEAAYERILSRVRIAALAAAQQGQPLISLGASDARELAHSLATAKDLSAEADQPPLLLPHAFSRASTAGEVGSLRASEARALLEARQRQTKNARKLEYLDRVRRRRELLVRAVARANPADLETFDEIYVLDVQQQIESGSLVADWLLEECAKKLSLKVPAELRLDLIAEVFEAIPTPDLDLLLKLIPNRLDEDAILLAWQIQPAKSIWKEIFVAAGEAAVPQSLIAQDIYLPPDRSSDPLSNPNILPWVAQRSNQAFEPLFRAISTAAEQEERDLSLRIRERCNHGPVQDPSAVYYELSALRLQALGLPIDDISEVSRFVEAFLSALEYEVKRVDTETDSIYQVSWSA